MLHHWQLTRIEKAENRLCCKEKLIFRTALNQFSIAVLFRQQLQWVKDVVVVRNLTFPPISAPIEPFCRVFLSKTRFFRFIRFRISAAAAASNFFRGACVFVLELVRARARADSGHSARGIGLSVTRLPTQNPGALSVVWCGRGLARRRRRGVELKN